MKPIVEPYEIYPPRHERRANRIEAIVVAAGVIAGVLFLGVQVARVVSWVRGVDRVVTEMVAGK